MINSALSAIKDNFAPKRITRLVKSPAWILFVTGFLSNSISIFTALFTLLVYDKVYPHNGFNTLVVLTLGVVALLIIDISVKLLRTRTINLALYGESSKASTLDRRAEFQIFSRALSSTHAGDYLKRSIQDLASVKPSDVKAATLIVDVPFVLLLLVAIYFIAGALVLVPLVSGLFLLTFIAWSHKRNTQAAKNLEVAKQRAIESYAYLSRGSEWLFGLGAWKWLVDREATVQEDVSAKSSRVASLNGIRQVVYQSTVQAAGIAIVFFGFFAFQEGLIGFGGVIATYILSNKVLSPIGTIVQMGAMADPVEASKSQDDKSYINFPTQTTEWHLAVSNLSFTYDGKTTPALNIKKLDIDKGQKVAVVGRSGSGKSTFAKLLNQMIQGYEGEVNWNQVPLASINPDSWMKQCVYVPQTPWLGSGSLFDQIRLGDMSITDEMIASAIGQTGLNEILTLDTQSVSSGGLSAGQLQALGLLRCLVRKAPLLILDEPTNFLDDQTENKMLGAIFEQYKESTILVITHRRSIVNLMDRVLVFDKGQVANDAQITREAT